MALEWHETYDNVTALGRWLIEHRDYDHEALQAYYEKPWKWSPEWKAYQESKRMAKAG